MAEEFQKISAISQGGYIISIRDYINYFLLSFSPILIQLATVNNKILG